MKARALTLVGVVLLAQPALADMTKEQCVRANATGQALRMDRKLAEARKQLVACADPSCPGIVRADCQQRLGEIDEVQPTVVFDVASEDGSPVRLESATLDGARIDPSGEVKLDPGEHHVVFVAAGRAPVSRTITVDLGQKARHERIAFAPPPAAPTPTPTPTQPIEAAPSETAAPAPPRPIQRIAAVSLGGVGLASIVVGSIFGGLTFAAASDQHASCATASTCTDFAAAQAAHDRGSTYGEVSDVTFVVGGILLAAGVVLWLTAPHQTSAVAVGPGSVFFRTTF